MWAGTRSAPLSAIEGGSYFEHASLFTVSISLGYEG